MAWQAVRQQRIYYESLGQGDAVLLLPGWAGSIIELDRLRHELSGAAHDVHRSHGPWLASTIAEWIGGH
jgi:hypothetical protein